MRLRPVLILLPVVLVLGACAGARIGGSRPAEVPLELAPVTPGRVIGSNPSAVSLGGPVALPATAGTGAATGALGTTTVTLGNTTRGGLWLMTPLVRSARNGRIVDTVTGRSTDVELLPLAWSATGGSQISHGAMHALGRDLTDLPELQVFGA